MRKEALERRPGTPGELSTGAPSCGPDTPLLSYWFTSSGSALVFGLTMDLDLSTDNLTNALLFIVRVGHGAVSTIDIKRMDLEMWSYQSLYFTEYACMQQCHLITTQDMRCLQYFYCQRIVQRHILTCLLFFAPLQLRNWLMILTNNQEGICISNN